MKRVLVFLSVLSLAGASLPASAAGSGQAYDQITKFQPGADIGKTEPGDFTSDWKTASNPPESEPPHGGMFGNLKIAIPQMNGAMAMMRNGRAESHWIAGLKERTDFPADQVGTITDCGARTITHLDLKAKTYYVVSMDQPQKPAPRGGRAPAPGPAATDDGTKFSMTVVNTALGPKHPFGNDASGYLSDITTVTTPPSGDPKTSTIHRKTYVSGVAQQWLNCSTGMQSGQGMVAAINRFSQLSRALALKDSRFSVSSSGPTVPTTLSYFEVMQVAGGDNGGGQDEDNPGRGRRGGNFAIVVERNNLRSIGPDDPALSVPAGFTKVDPPAGSAGY